jgi:hypothetical protein
MEKLSPKKFIQTRARSLPVYKCFLNSDWEATRLALVQVWRKHAGGKITAGSYLVDLNCLGVKDTGYFFSVPEEDLLETIQDPTVSLKEIDYWLAHNIVFAGLEFAGEFDIKPHPEFSLTKFILEEDTEAIPVIEIEVGDEEDGKPHLVEYQRGQYANALSKLKKNAGEGNFYYTVADDEFDEYNDEDEDDEDEDDNSEVSLADMPHGSIEAYDCGMLDEADLRTVLSDPERSVYEKQVAQLALICRSLLSRRTLDDAASDKEEKEWDLLEQFQFIPVGVTEREWKEGVTELATVMASLPGVALNDENQLTGIIKKLERKSQNVLVACTMVELASSRSLPDLNKSLDLLVTMADKYPVAKLTVNLADYIREADQPRFESEFGNIKLDQLREEKPDWGAPEVFQFSLIALFKAIREKDIYKVADYYELVTAMDRQSFMYEWLQAEVSRFFKTESDKTSHFSSQA